MGNYSDIGNLHDGLRRVSTRHIARAQVSGSPDFAPGIWGYIDATGKEIIHPQYIYATDFQNGTALVCKGKWEALPGKIKYSSPHPEAETVCYGSREELWGLIDKTGREIIPCIYAELHISEDGKYAIAERQAGAKNTSLVMDIEGEVVFEQEGQSLISYEGNDMITVCCGEYPEAELVGLYNLRVNKWILECKYTDIFLYANGVCKLTYKHEKTGRTCVKIARIT